MAGQRLKFGNAIALRQSLRKQVGRVTAMNSTNMCTKIATLGGSIGTQVTLIRLFSRMNPHVLEKVFPKVGMVSATWTRIATEAERMTRL